LWSHLATTFDGATLKLFPSTASLVASLATDRAH